LVVLLV